MIQTCLSREWSITNPRRIPMTSTTSSSLNKSSSCHYTLLSWLTETRSLASDDLVLTMGTRQSTLSSKDVACESSRKKLEKHSYCCLVFLDTLWKRRGCSITRHSNDDCCNSSIQSRRRSADMEDGSLVRLSCDVMSRVLSFLTANEINDSLRFTCQAMW